MILVTNSRSSSNESLLKPQSSDKFSSITFNTPRKILRRNKPATTVDRVRTVIQVAGSTASIGCWHHRESVHSAWVSAEKLLLRTAKVEVQCRSCTCQLAVELQQHLTTSAYIWSNKAINTVETGQIYQRCWQRLQQRTGHGLRHSRNVKNFCTPFQ